MNADAFIQQNSGGFDGVGNVTLPVPTVAGRRLIVVGIGAGGSVPVPSGWTADYAQGATSLIYSKPTADGEDTWAFGATGVAFEYDVFEVEGLDPTVPVDVTSASRGSGGSTGSSSQSTTYDGLILGVHAANGSVGGTTVLTFDAHSDFEELSDHGHATGGSFVPVSLSTCRWFVAQIGVWECTCDSPGAAFEEGVLVVYTAEGAKRAPLLTWFWAFPSELIGATGLDTGPANSRFWETQLGSTTIDADGLLLQATTAAEQITGRSLNFLFTTGLRTSVQALRFRLNTLPVADLELAATVTGAPAGAAGTTVLSYRAATAQLGLQVGSGTEQLSTMTVSADQWLDVDIRTMGKATEWTVDWRVDDGGGPVDQPQVVTTQTLTLPTTFTPRLGWSSATTGDLSVEYAVYSTWDGHYPLGTYQFVFLGPDPAATPTVSGTAASFRRFTANGTIDGSHNATAIRDALDDWPPVTGASADGLAVVTASASDYIEIPMATYDPAGAATVRAVMVLAPMWAASAAAATIRLRGWEGTDEADLFNEADPGADNGATPVWVCRMWQPTVPAGPVFGWDQTRLDSAAIRVGSNDATPDIGPHALGLLVGLQESAAQPLFGESTASLRVEQDLDPQTGGIQRLRAYTPADSSATLTYDLDEVEQTPVDVPADSNPLTVLLEAADTTVVSRISLVIDEPA